MVERISEVIISAMIDRHAVDPAERDIYEYGLQIILSGVISFASAMAVGVLFGRPLPMLIFLISFASIRMYSGGYHARSYLICFLELMALSSMVMVMMCGMEHLPSSLINIGPILVAAVSAVIIFALAPVEHENAPLSEQEMHHYRRVVRKICVLQFVIVLSLVIAPVSVFMPWGYCIGRLFFISSGDRRLLA